VDPTAQRCGLTTDPLTSSQPLVRQLSAEGILPSPWRTNGPTTRRQVLAWLRSAGSPWQPT
jgi:hypothetical protein